ncbi:citrate synthase [Calidifontibacter terrae]
MPEDLITTAQAAALLGVRLETIYAYVSRGLLRRAGDTSRHDGSAFHRSDVVALRDARRRSRDGVFEVSVDTSISRLEPVGQLSYRGVPLQNLVTTSYERVAELLWESTELDWDSDEIAEQSGRLARSLDAPAASAAARIRIAVAALSALDPDASPTAAGVRIINASLAALGAVGEGSVADRLATILGTDQVAFIDAALICLADHELATSTIAARVSAGTGAGPYDVVLAGLGALPGPRHGTASAAATHDLRVAAQRGVESIARAETPPAGFGHLVYRDTDPRAVLLLDLLRPVAPTVVELVDELTVAVVRRHSLWPNVDLALGALAIALDLPERSGETLFTLARTAGFLAHSQEERHHPLRFRPRASYVGPEVAQISTDEVTQEAGAQPDPHTENLGE